MKYNSKYNRWFTKGGLVYRYSKSQDKLVLCKQHCNNKGYLTFKSDKHYKVHRAVYETFVGEIPQGYEIDHINTIRDDNRVENLRAVTPKENSNNPITRLHKSKSHIGLSIPRTDFGKKFFEHFGFSKAGNKKLYLYHLHWYATHDKTCRWEKL